MMPRSKMLVIKAHGGQYGPGKVHFPANYNNALAQVGATLCGYHVYGEAVGEADNPVTCKRCIKRDQKNATGG